MIYFILFLIAALTLADFALTIICIRRGIGKEDNDALKGIVKHPVLFAVVKFVLGVLVLLAVWSISKYVSGFSGYILGLMFATWNLAVVLKNYDIYKRGKQ